MKNLLKASALFLALGLTSCDSKTATTKATSGAGGPPETTSHATGTTTSADTMAMGNTSPANATTADPNAPSTGTTTNPSATMAERKDVKAK